MSTERQTPTGWFLAALLGVSIWNYLDRAVIGILQEPIKHEFGLSDFQLGLLGGPAFALLYATLGIPFGRLAERANRVRLIAIVFAFWSIATALCGAATSFAFLLLARVAVGIGEAGCAPSAHSLISDRFPPAKRSMALAVFTSGISLGSLFAALAGGSIAQHFGWRTTFFVLGLSGLAIALLFVLTVREAPRCTAAEDTPPFAETFRVLWGRRVVWHVALAIMVAAALSLTTAQYLTSFFMRVHHFAIGDAVLRVALIMGVAGAIGTYAGGWLGNHLGKKDPGAATQVIAWCYLAAAPLSILGFLSASPLVAVVLLMLAVGLQTGYFGPTFAVLHASVEPRMRATAVAIVLLVSNLLGYGGGPPLIGKISDLLAKFLAGGRACGSADWLEMACTNPNAGALQLALALLALANFWAFYHFRQVSRLHREAASG